MRARWIGLACVLIVGCGPHKSGMGGDMTTLSIDPPTSELTINNGTLPTEAFTATLTYEDGHTQDVTQQTGFMIDPRFGEFASSTLTARSAGKTEVRAEFQGKTATAQVIVHVKDVRVDPAVSPNAPMWFTGPEDPSRAPRMVYPTPNSIIPRNLGDFEVHWTDSAGNDVFEVSLVTEFADVRAYVPGGNGSITGGSWSAFLAEEWRAAIGAETAVQYQVRGVQSSNPISVGSAPPQIVKLSNEDMLGGLYYWASKSTAGVEGIFRHDMSLPGQPAQQYMTTAQTSGRCVACHVLSHDGKHMLVTYEGGDHVATTVDVASAVAAPATNYWNFATFTPDGNEFLAVHQGSLVVRRFSDQSVVATMSASGWVTHPDLSPDGKMLVYVHPNANTGINDWTFDGGSIFVRTYDATSHTFGPEQQLVSDGKNNYYPSFSPDGQWILFNKAPIGGVAYNNANATLWVVKTDNSLPPIQLTTASSAPVKTDSWGRWAPFAQTFGANGEKMYWVTVSSQRDFGVRLVGVNRPQIWMTPFFPERSGHAQDPSASAFRLPFQSIDSNNHIAQWTEQIITVQ